MSQDKTHPRCRETDNDDGIKIGFQGRGGDLDDDRPEVQLTVVVGDLIAALGLVRVLTLCPIHNPGLEEVEERLARSLERISDTRSVLRSGGRR